MAKKLDGSDFWERPEPNGEPEGEPIEGPAPELPVYPQEVLRAARMERAKRLAQDPNYPSEEIVQTLAEMLARHWYS